MYLYTYTFIYCVFLTWGTCRLRCILVIFSLICSDFMLFYQFHWFSLRKLMIKNCIHCFCVTNIAEQRSWNKYFFVDEPEFIKPISFYSIESFMYYFETAFGYYRNRFTNGNCTSNLVHTYDRNTSLVLYELSNLSLSRRQLFHGF